MRTNEIKKTRGKSKAEITTMIAEKKKELTKIRLEHGIGKVKNVRVQKLLRIDIAQLQTIMHEQQLHEKLERKNETKKSE